jgi:DNA polymerase-3 subunit delta
MRIYVNQLGQSLNKIHPVYMVFGDEPMQKMQCIDAIRQSCSAQGYDERISLSQGSQWSWHELNSSGQNLSLFSQRQLIELELTSLKPGQEGSKAITRFLDEQTSDSILLIHGPKAASDTQKAKWFKALEAKGLYIAVTQPEGHHFVAWLKQDIIKKQLNVDPNALQLLAQMFEGNLLAASQELEKLSLQVGQQRIDIKTLKQRVTNQSRFSLFELQDALLAGQTEKALKILVSLQREEIEPQLLYWAFNRELTLLVHLKKAQVNRQSLTPLFQQERVWASRQKLFEQALSRLSLPKLVNAVNLLGELEQSIKVDFNLPWDKITQLTLHMTGEH